MITLEKLKENFSYNKRTGLFTRKTPGARKWKVGDIAGTITPKGYVAIKIGDKSYLAHILAWFYVTGEWPTHIVDHEDNVKSNNVWTNLRPASASQNGANAKLYCTNTLGHKHVSIKGSGYRVRVTSCGKITDFGTYPTLEEAVAVATRARATLHGEFARAA